METTNQKLPRKAILSVALGIFLMTLFASFWNGAIQMVLQGKDQYISAIIINILAVIFLGFSVYFVVKSKKFPKELSESDTLKSKKMSKQYALLFGGEILAILFAFIILRFLHLEQYFVPVIVLIIGLHFFPMAKLFNRKADIYIASFVCIVAFIGIYLVFKNYSAADVTLLCASAMVIALFIYATVMISDGLKYLKK